TARSRGGWGPGPASVAGLLVSFAYAHALTYALPFPAPRGRREPVVGRYSVRYRDDGPRHQPDHSDAPSDAAQSLTRVAVGTAFFGNAQDPTPQRRDSSWGCHDRVDDRVSGRRRAGRVRFARRRRWGDPDPRASGAEAQSCDNCHPRPPRAHSQTSLTQDFRL